MATKTAPAVAPVMRETPKPERAPALVVIGRGAFLRAQDEDMRDDAAKILDEVAEHARAEHGCSRVVFTPELANVLVAIDADRTLGLQTVVGRIDGTDPAPAAVAAKAGAKVVILSFAKAAKARA